MDFVNRGDLTRSLTTFWELYTTKRASHTKITSFFLSVFSYIKNNSLLLSMKLDPEKFENHLRSKNDLQALEDQSSELNKTPY